MENNYINVFNKKNNNAIAEKLKQYIGDDTPIFVCVGSDLVLGDSLGPLVGTMLRKKELKAYVYGTLNFPITAKEIEYVRKYLKIMHKNCKVVCIDASIGDANDIGTIKIKNCGIKPGLGVNKNIEVIGDVSIIGVVASKSVENVNLYNLTRLNLIYKLADVIVNGIEEYIGNNLFATPNYSVNA